MNIKDIEKKIAEEQEVFNSAVYPNKLPTWFIEVFKKSFMVVPPYTHKLPLRLCRAIAEKKVSELTNMEVRYATNLIILAEPEKIYKDFKSAISQFEILNGIVVECNYTAQQLEKELTVKKTQLMELAGIGVSRPKIYQA